MYKGKQTSIFYESFMFFGVFHITALSVTSVLIPHHKSVPGKRFQTEMESPCATLFVGIYSVLCKLKGYIRRTKVTN